MRFLNLLNRALSAAMLEIKNLLKNKLWLGLRYNLVISDNVEMVRRKIKLRILIDHNMTLDRAPDFSIERVLEIC